MLVLLRLLSAAGARPEVTDVIVLWDKDLEALEETPRPRGLRAEVADKHTCANPDVSEATEQGCVEGKGHRTIGHLQRAEWSESTLMASLPNALQLVARSLPLVKLPMSDLSLALQATHLDLP